MTVSGRSPLYTSLALVIALLWLIGCHSSPNHTPNTPGPTLDRTGAGLAPEPSPGEALATLAGGCFWCMEPPFEKLDGVSAVISGYTGGSETNPTYQQVSSGATTHLEAVQVYYDPNRVTFAHILEVYWRSIDPTDAEGQFADRGPHYRPVIFVHNEEQKQVALNSRQQLEQSKRFSKPIVVPIEDASVFWQAEEYHQDYYKKNPQGYLSYYRGSGRAAFLERMWPSP